MGAGGGVGLRVDGRRGRVGGRGVDWKDVKMKTEGKKRRMGNLCVCVCVRACAHARSLALEAVPKGERGSGIK